MSKMKQAKNKISKMEWDKKFKMNWDETLKLDVPVKIDHDSIEKCKEIVGNNPDDSQAHLSLGVAYYLSGMRNESVGPYKQAIRIDPDNIDAYHNLAITFSEIDMNEEEIESSRQVLRVAKFDTREIEFTICG